jgi:hypothetical protein
MTKISLFSQYLLENVIEHQKKLIIEKIDAIPNDQFMNTSEERIIEHVESIVDINPLKLYEDEKTMEKKEIEFDVSGIRARNPYGGSNPIYVKGIRIVVSIPFTGDTELLNAAPLRTMVFYQGTIVEKNSDGIGYIKIEYEQPLDEDPSKIKKYIDEQIRGIKSKISEQAHRIQEFNESIRSNIEQAIRIKKDRLKKYDDIVEFIGIPLKPKVGVPDYKKINLAKRQIKPLPSIPKEGYKPEPGISAEQYEYILNVIRHEGRTFEGTPETFHNLEEEELRNILLAHLNGHFQGSATGETFRKKGKTDIRIEDNNRAAFSAECKIWHGKTGLFESVEQLLGYLTWRDCKASIIIFNKHNAKFSDILNTIPNVLPEHNNHIKKISDTNEGEWRYLFSSEDDENRQIIIHFFVFNLFVNAKTKA